MPFAARQVLVVQGPLLRPLEQLVSGDESLELLLSCRIAGMQVRVTGLGGVAKRHPDRLVTGVSRHAKNIIERTHQVPACASGY